MADKYTVKAKRGGKPSIDAGMAALAAASVGFVSYAMPAGVFEGLVGMTGLAALTAYAEPPIGAISRYAIIAGAAALTFALIYALLRALERLPSGNRSRGAEVSADPPRLRRADAHPDAPARRPLFARFDLGDPLVSEQAKAQDAEELPEAAAEPLAETAEAPAAEAQEEQSLPGLLGAGLEISEGEPVAREAPADAEPDHPLPSFIAPVEAEQEPAAEEQPPIEAPENFEPVEEIAAEEPLPAPEPEAELPVAEGPEPIVEAIEDEPAVAEEAEAVAAAEEEPAVAEEAEAVAAAEEEPAVAEEAEAAAAAEEEPAVIAETPSWLAPEEEEAVAAPEEAAPAQEEIAAVEAEAEPVAEQELAAAAEEEPAAIAEEAPVSPAVDEFGALLEGQGAAAEQAITFPGDEPVAEQAAPAAAVEEEPEAQQELPAANDAAPARADEAAPAPAATDAEPIGALAARIPELPEPRNESVSELMGRLEVGLGRRDRASWTSKPDAASASDAPIDDRLRSALGMLRKMANRGR
jgi:hypothetical protein